jgi:endonuclease/exonuclease/phosphatase family metal-dependent hydrolase
MKILSWNVALTTCSLRLFSRICRPRKTSSQKIFELINKIKPDILCFQEVQSYAYNFLYSLLKKDYPHSCYNPELGLLIVSKMYLQSEESVLFPKNTFTTCCGIRTGIIHTFVPKINKYIVNVHLPLRKHENDSILNQLKDCINSLNREIILLGDFNVDYPDLFNVLNTLNVKKSPIRKITFTHLVNYQLDYMFYITKNERIPLEYQVIQNFESDHYPIIYSFS